MILSIQAFIFFSSGPQDHSSRTELLIKQLGSVRIEERIAAERELMLFREAARPLLEKATEHHDPEVVLRVRQALQFLRIRDWIGPSIERDFPGLIGSLEKGELTWCEAFLLASTGLNRGRGKVFREDLALLGRHALDRAGSSTEKKGILVAIAYHRLFRLTSRVAWMLENGGSEVEQECMATLRKLGARSTVPLLAKRVAHSDAGIRNAACSAIRELGLKEAVPELCLALDHPLKEVRERALTLLIEAEAPEAIPGLLRRLGDPNPQVRQLTIAALRKLRAKEAVPGIVKALEDRDRLVRLEAIRSLAQLGVWESAGALERRLKDPEVVVRQAAVHALGRLGAEEAGPRILELVDDPEVCQSALYVLGLLRVEEAIPAMRKALKHPDPYVRRQAAMALARMGGAQPKE